MALSAPQAYATEPIVGISKPDEQAFQQAKQNIEAVRKGGLELHVVDAAGKSVSGVEVRYRQVSHDFLFGVTLNEFDPVLMQHWKAAGINHGTFHFNWRLTQPTPDRNDFYDMRYRLGLEQLKAAGWTLKAHAVFWFSPKVIPHYVRSAKPADFQALSRARITALVNQFGDAIDIWELTNEPLAPWANVRRMTVDDLGVLLQNAAAGVQALDPTARTLINFADPLGSTYKKLPLKPLDLPTRFAADKLRYDILGLQFYYNAFTPEETFERVSLARMAEQVEAFAKHGKEIHITELCAPGASQAPRGYWGRDWSLQLQADYLTVAYTLFFAEPAVRSITWWDDTDGGFIHRGGLLDANRQPKPAYHALQRLIRQWTTTGMTITDAQGRARLRGFGGRYEATIRDPASGLTTDTTFAVREREALTHRVRFDRAQLQHAADGIRKARETEAATRIAQAEALLVYWQKKKGAVRTRYAGPEIASAKTARAAGDFDGAMHSANRAAALLAVPRATTVDALKMHNSNARKFKLKKEQNGELFTNSHLTFDHEFIGGPARIELTARGTYPGGTPPRANILVGDQAYAQAEVNRTEWGTYAVDLTVRPGRHKVVIRYINDWQQGDPKERKLSIQQARIIEYLTHVPND